MTKPLAAFRAEIDAIDDKLIALLRERIGIVKQVGELKSKEEKPRCYLRPGREADMVRRIYAHFGKTDFSPFAAALMWRQIISASLSVESPMKIAVFTPEADPTLYWIAREYFGAYTPIRREQSAQRVVAEVADGRAQVGILPLPSELPQGDWWRYIARDGDLPKIFAYVPFITGTSEYKQSGALAIAFVEPEETQEDVSLYVLRIGQDTSQSRINAAFAKAGLDAQWITHVAPHPDRRLYLVEIKGFHAPESEKVKQFRAEAGTALDEWLYLGSYATPILVD
jgi:chorismate mutase